MLLPTSLAVLALLAAVIGLIVHLKRRAQGRTEPPSTHGAPARPPSSSPRPIQLR